MGIEGRRRHRNGTASARRRAVLDRLLADAALVPHGRVHARSVRCEAGGRTARPVRLGRDGRRWIASRGPVHGDPRRRHRGNERATRALRAAGGLEELLLAFRERHGEPLEAAAFGIAGPVVAGRVATTNLPWVVDAVELARVLGLLEVVLMNDLEALAWSLDVLVPEGLAELQAGQADAAGNRALIAAG